MCYLQGGATAEGMMEGRPVPASQSPTVGRGVCPPLLEFLPFL